MAIDHFEKHKAQTARTDWNFNFLFDTEPQVAELAAKYAMMLEYPGLHKPVPGQWLHATLLRVGYLEEFSEAEMLKVAALIEPKLANMKLPKFMLGQWWLWGGSPCLHITPDDPLQQVFQYLTDALREVVGEKRLPKLSFMPHVTLAYAKTYDDELGLYEKLQSQPVEGVELRISSVSLIKQRIVDDYYAWEVVKDLKIGRA